MSENKKRKRDEIEQIRTIYWFEGVRMATRSPTAYAIERLIEPESFGVNKGGVPFHRNKWASYQNGRHTPSDALVTRVNLRVAGSSKELNHVLWKALSQNGDVSRYANEWLRQLSPELQLLIFEKDDHFRTQGGSQFLGKIERRASLDVLAYLTILLRINYDHGNHEGYWKLAVSTYRVLLMLGHHFNERGIADALFDIYVERIFGKIRWNNRMFYFDECTFSKLAFLLNVCVRSTKQFKEGATSWHYQVQCMQRIFRTDYGFTWKCAFDPLIGPDPDIGPISEKEQKEFEQNRRLLDWGLDNIFTGRNTDLPPSKVWNG